MLVYPPRDGVFLGKRWNLEGDARLAVQREAWLGYIVVIDAYTKEIEVHNGAQLACENAEEFL
jgi:hypothetical protein